MVLSFLEVAVGGAAGATLRYAVSLGVLRALGPQEFPVAIMAVNVAGSFAMGVFVVVAARHGLTQLTPLVAAGLLGGFTTFSSFSLEAAMLWDRGATGLAALYVGLSVGLSLLAIFAGMAAARSLA